MKEQFPPANYSPETQDSNERYAEQAKAHNAKRPLLQKLTRKNELTGMDLLRDDAERINRLVDEQGYSESFHKQEVTPKQVAADRIAASPEFNSPLSVGAFKFSEFLRQHDKLTLDLLNNLQLGSAIKRAQELESVWEKDNPSQFDTELRVIIREKLHTHILANDAISIRMMLESVDSDMLADWIPADLVPHFPSVVLQNPHYAKKLIRIIEKESDRLDHDTAYLLAELQKLQAQD